MAFADPQSITVAAGGTLVGTTSLPRVTSSDASKTVYTDTTGGIRLEISQKLGSRRRAHLRFVFSKTATDPLIPAQNVPYSASLTIITDLPTVGITVAEMLQNALGAVGLMAANSNLDWTKAMGGEQ